VRVLLDTQVLYLAASASGLRQKVRVILENPDNDRLISSASILEIALKHMSGKIEMPENVVRQAVEDLGLSIMAFEPRHAYQLFSLPLHHRDPFDRMIIATAIAEDIPLIGGDRKFARYSGLQRIW